MSPEITDRILVLDREVRGDRLFHLTVLGERLGVGLVLLRRSRKRATPDLYDSVQVQVGRKSTTAPWFVGEFEVLRRRERLARDWKALATAARLSRFFERNATHVEHVSHALVLATQALDALEESIFGEAVLLKTLFRFAQAEGFAVREDWLPNLSETDRRHALAVLGKPLREGGWEGAEPTPALAALVFSLEDWLRREADFHF